MVTEGKITVCLGTYNAKSTKGKTFYSNVKEK